MSETTVTPLRIRHLADKSEGSRVVLHRVPEAAVVQEDGFVVFDAGAVERILVNPDTAGYDHESWASAGRVFEGGAPQTTRTSQRFVAGAKAEGWVETEGEKIVYVPGGPPENPTAKVHAFVELDAIVFHMADGDVRYRVTRQPGKHEDAEEPAGYRIDFTYDLEREV